MDVLQRGIIQFIDQNQLKKEDWPHNIELGSIFEDSVLENIAENHDLVKEDQQCEVCRGLFGFLFGDGIQKLLF